MKLLHFKKILILRHGAAEQQAPRGDRHRHLTAQGKQEAATIAEKLRTFPDYVPEHVFCSNAVRTQETWEAIVEFWPMEAPSIDFCNMLGLEAEDILKKLESFSGNARSLMCIGHNPFCSEIASFLSGQEIAMGTANAILLEAPIDYWSELRLKKWHLVEWLKP